MTERTVTVSNPQGLHARPASMLVERAGHHPCEITIERDGREVNAKSILGVLTLACVQGTVLVLRARGADSAVEETALNELVELFDRGFHEA